MISFVIILGLVIALLIFMAKTARSLRKGGGSSTVFLLGATDAFNNQDRSRAAEVIVNEKAGKKLDSQTSDGPEDK